VVASRHNGQKWLGGPIICQSISGDTGGWLELAPGSIPD